MQGNVLVVDDSEVSRALLESVLKQQGLGVFEAANGLEALTQLRSHEIHAVVTDIDMPEMDGPSLISRIRSSSRWHALKLIVITADEDVGIEEALLAIGADHVVRKGSNVSSLIEWLSQHL